MTTLAIVGLVAPLAHATLDGFRHRLITIRNRKVGGIRFIRIGRYQMSFCKCRVP